MHEGSCSYCLISTFEGEVFYVKYHSSNINSCFLYLLLTKGQFTTVRNLFFSCQNKVSVFMLLLFKNVYCR